MNSPHCDCLDREIQREWSEKRFHRERQDTESVGWKRLLDLVETAAACARRSETRPVRRSESDHPGGVHSTWF